MSKGIGINKTNGSRRSIRFHIRYFHEINLRFLVEASSDCCNLMMKIMSSNDVNIVSVKGKDYKIHLLYMSNEETINILEILIWLKKLNTKKLKIEKKGSFF